MTGPSESYGPRESEVLRLRELVDQRAELRPVLESHLEGYGELIPHLLMAEVVDWVAAHRLDAPGSAVDVIGWMNHWYQHGTDEVQNLIAVSGIEAIPNPGRKLGLRLSGQQRITLLDVRGSITGPPGLPEYEAGHVPGAVFVELETELSGTPGEGGRHPCLTPRCSKRRCARRASTTTSRWASTTAPPRSTRPGCGGC